MARKVSYALLASFLVFAFLTTHNAGRAQEGQTPQPASAATPIVVTPDSIAVLPPARPPYGIAIQQPALVLRWQDNGGVFTVPVSGLIFVQLPVYPFSHLDFDPGILRLFPIRPLPVQPNMQPAPELTPDPQSGIVYPQPGWRLIAIRPGTTPLSVVPEPCRRTPCPMLPVINFRVTIVVSGEIYPPPPPPPLPVHADVYIGTAYFNQTVSIQPGQIVTLDLPYLEAGRRVQVQFDPALLQAFPGENTNVAQPGGWHFRVVGTGTTVLTVRDVGCTDASSDCPPALLFQVTLTTDRPIVN